MTALRVIEIFDSLQGEGYWTGVPMTFVRLAGCNASALGLDCVQWCDTPDSWSPLAGEEMEAIEVVRRVHLPRLCLTGGEPLLQVEGVTKLVAEAHRLGIHVHVETNGTVDPGRTLRAVALAAAPAGPAPGDDAIFDWAVVSPKPPGYVIAPGWEKGVDELKLVVDERLDAATAERLAACFPEAVVSIQPEYGEGAEAGRAGRVGAGESVQRAVALVMDHPGWRLSLQTHKFLGIR